MIRDHLTEKKLDGLFNAQNECACLTDTNKFIPCDNVHTDCQGGINIPLLNNSDKFNPDEFTISTKSSAIENWPDCPKCKGTGNIPENNKLDLYSCEDCRSTGKIIRNKKDYETLGDLFYTRSYNKLLIKAQQLSW